MPYYYGIMHKHKRIKERAPHMLQQKKNKGFTIIEVLIVLAIAGLIMLVVFLAVPALQRNARNQGRNSDAQTIVAAVNECLSNKNGVKTSCNEISASEVQISADKLNQLVADDGTTSNITNGADSTLIAAKNGTANVTQNVTWQFGTKCSSDGSAVESSTNIRTFTVFYEVENNSNKGVSRCIGS